MTNLYPVYMNIENLLCLVVGGGKVAERKIGSLLEAEAKVKVVSPKVTPMIREWALRGKLELLKRDYQTSDLSGAYLVFAATNNNEVNHMVAEDSKNRNLIVNIADAPKDSSFFVPSVIRRGKLTIAVSTSGASPLLAARIRRQLELQFGQEYQEFLDILTDIRQEVLANVQDIEQRKKIFRDLVNSDILDLLKQKKYDQVKERIKNAYCGYRS